MNLKSQQIGSEEVANFEKIRRPQRDPERIGERRERKEGPRETYRKDPSMAAAFEKAGLNNSNSNTPSRQRTSLKPGKFQIILSQLKKNIEELEELEELEEKLAKLEEKFSVWLMWYKEAMGIMHALKHSRLAQNWRESTLLKAEGEAAERITFLIKENNPSVSKEFYFQLSEVARFKNGTIALHQACSGMEGPIAMKVQTNAHMGWVRIKCQTKKAIYEDATPREVKNDLEVLVKFGETSFILEPPNFSAVEPEAIKKSLISLWKWEEEHLTFGETPAISQPKAETIPTKTSVQPVTEVIGGTSDEVPPSQS